MGRALLLFAWTVVACASARERADLGVYEPADASPSGPVVDAARDGDVAAPGDAGEPVDGAEGTDGELPAVDADASGERDAAPSFAACIYPGCLGAEEAEDWNLYCFDLEARSVGGSINPYVVTQSGDQYVTFTVRKPNTDARYVRSIKPIVGAPSVLHDMRLYQHRGSLPEGTATGVARGSDLQLLFSWAPGVSDLELETAVAMPIQSDGWLTLEVHYVYAREATLPAVIEDRSGMRVCVTSSPTKYPVSFARLGSERFEGMHAEGTCAPSATQPIQLLAVRARMNAAGRRAKLVLLRSTGQRETLYDEAFAFSEESLRPLPPTLLAPGDELLSTCDYQQNVRFGAEAREEVCELHVLHAPAGALVSAGATDSCLQ